MSAHDDQRRAPVLRTQYRPSAWWLDSVDLDFDLDPLSTRVTSRMRVRRNPDVAAEPLSLSGVGLETRRVELDGKAVNFEERAGEELLIIEDLPDQAELVIEVLVSPERNTAFEGLYCSGRSLLTQCEAEGFRKITWFLDRPDIMARYRVRLCGDREQFPVLLSNGNLVDSGDAGEGRHFAVWEDPFPKPSYLFAIVAGDLAECSDSYTTGSGRKVALKFYSEAENIEHLDHAILSLKRAMAWDEQRFGLEYDLDIFHVVATHDFNMGAMENKSLNIFNARYLLADRDTATDEDFEAIESVIGHEYFHNWTGNRVTCRDWFQLTLKEGLTVFRDQEFSADLRSRGVKRIQDVKSLMVRQFPEDAGPMAHPIRPERYTEINNFYTATVYEKGAEVVRMYQTLLGRDGFRRGMDLYFARHDGQAVSCDDFRDAMADANARSLDQFERWYRQVGTPVVEARMQFDAAAGEMVLNLRQRLSEHPDNRNIGPLLIPIQLGFLDVDNRPLEVNFSGEHASGEYNRLLLLDQAEAEFRFTGLPATALPSLLRDYSAPVRLEYAWSDHDLARLAGFDPDPFSRWQAMRRLSERVLAAMIGGSEPANVEWLGKAWVAVLEHSDEDPALAAELLSLPSESELADNRKPVDVVAIHAARKTLKTLLAQHLEAELLERFQALRATESWSSGGADSARRSLRNVVLDLLAAAGADGIAVRVGLHYTEADNMSDRLAALRILVWHELDGAEQALADFEQRYADNPLVMDKWFAVQATRASESTFDDLRRLLEHEAFRLDNPNKVRALIGSFALNNPLAFHRADGAAYQLLADLIIRLDDRNPQIAARLLSAFSRWPDHDQARAAMMKAELERIVKKDQLSVDSEEVLTAILRH